MSAAGELDAVDVLVVGGGPAGSTAAAVMAKAGLRVLLLEAGSHPRPHVGESLLPGIIPILAEIDALAEVEAAGFGRKTGSTLWGWGKTPRWDLWFHDSDAYEHAWLVERSRFDAILFNAARRAGADLRERAVARSLLWEGERLVGVTWDHEGLTRETRARLVIDATGQSMLLGRAKGRREEIGGLKHQAMWAHFTGCVGVEPPRHEQALFLAEADQWWWFFPIGGGRASVGVVQLDAGEARGAPRRDYDGLLAAARELQPVLGPAATRVTPVRHERDWSYRMSEVTGPGWIQIGDAAGFIDPVLSTGVLLALHSAWHAGRTAVTVLQGGADEAAARAAYQAHHREMFGDLLRMVRFYYQQNLYRDDYFWESKRILLTRDTELKPQKAFVVLTSGLVQNLALDEVRDEATARQTARAEGPGRPLGEAPPERLGFVCVHLRERAAAPGQGDLYLLVEPRDPVAPALARTRNFDVGAIAPRHGNDPLRVPAFAPVIRGFVTAVQGLDAAAGTELAAFWRESRVRLGTWLKEHVPENMELVRVFGE
ncbi:NAD(P)/FAD-dependent oxidoreductase [Nannocystis sp. SCPEA4]|uniref:NAD(P)/FAD-dependent oxidoreductase n=1 Tax=Nannocystis sp. SCPEA4 TaxID=2996787 RepID=UPI00226F7ED3|nr:NAD(P)/FAD-dependent oxidoreductase [Nannocystis sp. SCPEA4]MCY1053893.1 NAD(P)/FAD-dependent oxidoreductase [Nannocystis sp. SCPEA4]